MAGKRSTRCDEQVHKQLVLWAADCAEHVLPFFVKKHPYDDRPRIAIEAGRAWVRGEVKFIEVRSASLAAHAAARAATDPAAIAAARSAGQAAATVHVLRHAQHAAKYAVKAANAASACADASTLERDWQRQRIPSTLWPIAFSS
jgi:hypothetical protein